MPCVNIYILVSAVQGNQFPEFFISHNFQLPNKLMNCLNTFLAAVVIGQGFLHYLLLLFSIAFIFFTF